MDSNDEHSLKILPLTVVTLLGIDIEVSDEQPLKAELPIEMILLGKSIFFRLGHS